ncbi:MAG: hypothetical protein GY868_02920 [Deltaproteobacteria bacterium]|nr:hypothetical protein [Deltaproteobacteria bacterium]
MPVAAYTLLSGGAKGAEAAFGECAQRWGLQEINYTFDGHTPVRDRGLIRLSPAELEQGRVSDRYITAQMHRTYPDTQLFRNVLQSIWHQVNTSGEVFAVGTIQPDKTVRGGTGWAAELARHWHKPIHVFDQEKLVWFKWGKDDWNEVENPVISRTRFAGSGTRFLNDEGREAIRKLFVRSFGEL